MFAKIGNLSGPRFAMLDNIFGFAGQPTSILCHGAIAVSPICFPASWTLSGPATIISGQNTNQIVISATGNGTVHLIATYGNYLAETDITVSTGPPPLIVNANYVYNGASRPLEFYDGTSSTYNPDYVIYNQQMSMFLSPALTLLFGQRLLLIQQQLDGHKHHLGLIFTCGVSDKQQYLKLTQLIPVEPLLMILDFSL